MDTMQITPPTRQRWFGGLRRSDSKVLGGVAAGFAEFWRVDPLVVRVVLAAPFVTALLSWVGLVGWGVFLGALAVPLVQLLWLVSAALGLGYVMCWGLVPRPGAESLVRRILGRGGVLGTLVKLTALLGALFVATWLAVAGLMVLGNLHSGAAPAVVLLGLVALVLLGVWMGRGGDLREAVQRFGSPGFGRPGHAPGAATEPPPAPPAEPAGQPTTVLPMAPAEAPRSREPIATYDETEPIPDSVERARAAAAAAADAEAAWAEAERRARNEERRRRRAAARALRKERNRWGRLVTAVTLMTAGVLFLTDRLGSTDLGGLGIGLVALALLTAGVVVGAWFGSARWLILPAFALAGVLAAGSLASTALDHASAAAPLQYAPKSLPADEQLSMYWDAAAVTVDLTGTRQLDARSLSLDVTRGSLTVVVPADQWVTVSSSVLVGTNSLDPGGLRVDDIDLFSSGYRELSYPGDQADTSDAPLYLDLSVAVGNLSVIQKES